MEVIFLGTNGWYDTSSGSTICTLVMTNEFNIILDAGNGIHKLDKFIKNSNPIYLFLSHFHLDHVSGLHILNKFNFDQGIHIYGRKGISKVLNKLINEPFTVPFLNLPYRVDIHEVSLGLNNEPILFECLELLHPFGCLGFRFSIDDKVLTYCSDTGICDNAIKLANNADLLITECSLRLGETDPKWPHLNPEAAVDIAEKSKAKRLALTHFDASRYITINDRMEIAGIKTRFGHIIIASDGKSVNI